MNFRPRHLLIRWILPTVWRSGSGQRARVLQEFSQTELDSAWQSLYAIDQVSDPELSALLFQHAFEELEHSDLFRRLAEKKSELIPMIPLTRREPLLELKQSSRRQAAEFFAFLAIGENEIRKDFGVYEHAIPDAETRELFQAICKDEESHAEDSSAALAGLVEKNGLSLSWIRLRHLARLAYRRYISLAGKFGLLPMGAMLFLAYLFFGGLFFRQARRRLKLGGKEQLEFLKRQQEAFQLGLPVRP